MLAQSKTIWAAVFSMVLIGRRFRPVDWASFVLLAAGVTIVQVDRQPSSSAPTDAEGEDSLSFFIGSAAALTAAALSGFAGVFIELMFTKKGNSLWLRNVQLCLFTIPIQILALVGHRLFGTGGAEARPFFAGFHPSTLAVIAVQAIGGIINSMVIKYAGNMPKTFAAAASIIVTSLFSVAFFTYQPPFSFWLGVVTVVLATLMFEAKALVAAIMAAAHGAIGGHRAKYQPACSDRTDSASGVPPESVPVDCAPTCMDQAADDDDVLHAYGAEGAAEEASNVARGGACTPPRMDDTVEASSGNEQPVDADGAGSDSEELGMV